jgi:hypothetical protein
MSFPAPLRLFLPSRLRADVKGEGKWKRKEWVPLMKKIFFLLIIFILPIWVYSQATQPADEMSAMAELDQDTSSTGGANPVGSFKPLLPIREALTVAEHYVKEKQVDVSGQYIHFVRLYYDGGSRRKGHYWRVQWMWSTPRLGMEYGLRVYMDGAVVPDPSGP